MDQSYANQRHNRSQYWGFFDENDKRQMAKHSPQGGGKQDLGATCLDASVLRYVLFAVYLVAITDIVLGFNFNEFIGVLPTCTSESEPPKYEPLRTGDVRRLCHVHL